MALFNLLWHSWKPNLFTLLHRGNRKHDDNVFLLQTTISVYDALGKLPLGNLSYTSVLKPLIDLDFVSQTKNYWMDVSMKLWILNQVHLVCRIWRKGEEKKEKNVRFRKMYFLRRCWRDVTGCWRGWPLQMIICKRPVPPDVLLQEAFPSRWSFARRRSLQMIICKRLIPPDDHLQEADSSRWSFARGEPLQIIICKRLPLQMIICKRLAPPEDNLQEAGPSEWSFARRWPLQMIICVCPL